MWWNPELGWLIYVDHVVAFETTKPGGKPREGKGMSYYIFDH
jgi:hypothetical protein